MIRRLLPDMDEIGELKAGFHREARKKTAFYIPTWLGKEK
jgi:hypothetical protein